MEEIKHCGNCLHRGIDGMFEPCQSCLEGAKYAKVFKNWCSWRKSTEAELRRRRMREGK